MGQLMRPPHVGGLFQSNKAWNVADGTSVWTGRALQAGCGDLEIIGLAHLYSAL